MSDSSDRVVPIHGRRSGGGRCPLCDKPSETRFRPFCSKRCADLDLGRWLHGAYSIPSEEVPSEDALDFLPGVDPDSET